MGFCHSFPHQWGMSRNDCWLARVVRLSLQWRWIRRLPIRDPPSSYWVLATVHPMLGDFLSYGVLDPARSMVFCLGLWRSPKRGSVVSCLGVSFRVLNRLVETFWFGMLPISPVHLALRPGSWLTNIGLQGTSWYSPPQGPGYPARGSGPVVGSVAFRPRLGSVGWVS